ncbi:MAG: hypothetical protein JWM74_605 [Myxococcaceae bacterium]|jgi:hypothetical protein|nr:hypothetical protein [Myxococcaceae bacterium]
MNKNRIAFIAIGGLLVAAAAVGAAACSDTTNTGTPTPTVDGSKADGGGTTDDGSTTEGDGSVKKDGGTSGEAGKDCGTGPGLHNTPDAGIYCPFQADAGPDAGSRYCPQLVGEHCCMYGATSGKPSTCNTVATPCDSDVDAGGADFECDEPSDCPGPQKCCLRGSVKKDPVCYNFGSLIKGSHCAVNCPAGELTMCSTQAECAGVGAPGGPTCSPFDTKAKELGACLP